MKSYDPPHGIPDRPRRRPLSAVLAGWSAVLVFVTAAAVSSVAAVLLRRLAEQQAVARVELAGRAAADMLEGYEEEMAAAARVLADRPTLARLLAESDARALGAFLAGFCAPAAHAACAVVREGAVVAAVPSGYVPPDAHRAGVTFMANDAGAVDMVAVAPLANGEGSAVVARTLDETFTGALSRHLGMPVRVLLPHMPAAAIEGAVRDEGAIRTLVPLRSRGVGGAGLLELALPVTDVERSVATLLGTLLAAAAVVTLLAAAGAILIGRHLARPLLRLAESARRIGGGDLATPVRSAPGDEVGRLAATMEDMRLRLLRLTADLRRSQAEAQALLDGIVEGVFAVDEERRIRYLNVQAASLLGIEPERAIGRFCGDVLRPASGKGNRPCEGRCPIVHARSRGNTRATEVLQLADGRRRTVVITSSQLSEGRQVQVMRDETDFEGARRARDAIIANVSHEFRTPLSAQLASLELLRSGLSRNGEAAEADPTVELVRSAQRSSLRLVQLVDNLLESVRLESGEDAIVRRPVEIDEIVEEATEVMAPLLQQRNQQLDISLPFPAPRLLGDRQRLTQVLVNLLANASKYAPEDSCVRLRVVAESGALRVDVDDAGPGIPAGSEATIFDPFVRGGEAEAGGMGLGLWIVKSIVERHGGSIQARALREGGSRFTFVLPVDGDA